MAKKITNDKKRSEMKIIMESLLGEKGWKPAEVAAVIGVTPSNISSWKAGKNMGTNEARRSMSILPAKSDPTSRGFMVTALDSAKHHVEVAQRHLTEAQNGYEGFLAEATHQRDFQIEYHTKEIAAAHEKAEKAQRAAGALAAATSLKNNNLRNWESEYLINYISKKQYDDDTKTSYEHDVAYHTNALNEALAETPDTLAATAKGTQDNSIQWNEKVLAKAAKHLKDMEKVLAKW